MSVDDTKAVRLWAFDDAPEELRRLSRHGGDEDWVAWIPPGAELPEGILNWYQDERHEFAGGQVVIWAH